MGFSYLLCYLSKGGHICKRLVVEGKCTLPREDNIADMKNPCDKLYIACFTSNAMFFIGFLLN